VTKLARSIHCAMAAAGQGDDWRAVEIASSVLEGLRQRLRDEPRTGAPILTSEELSDAVECVLKATGYARAALFYAGTRIERQRRSRLLADRGLGSAAGAAPWPSGRFLERN